MNWSLPQKQRREKSQRSANTRRLDALSAKTALLRESGRKSDPSKKGVRSLKTRMWLRFCTRGAKRRRESLVIHFSKFVSEWEFGFTKNTPTAGPDNIVGAFYRYQSAHDTNLRIHTNGNTLRSCAGLF